MNMFISMLKTVKLYILKIKNRGVLEYIIRIYTVIENNTIQVAIVNKK